MKKILIVEDDVTLREELQQFLTNNGYEACILPSFEHALQNILAMQVSLILMDIGIPGVNGEFLCREIRKESNVPIIMVTSQKSEMHELISINYGADDYIVKPYNPQILLARIEAVMKRYYQQDNTKIAYQDMYLNMSKSVLEKAGEEYELSKNEAKVFYFLLKHKGSIVSREQIMDFLWGSEEFIDDNTLTVNITRLRKKLEDIGYQDIIETKRGQGYIIA